MIELKVAAALIEKEGRYLIVKKSTGDKNVLGKWEFSGGKREHNEDEMTAIEREIREEFELKVIRFITNNVCHYPERKVDLRLYECKYVGGDFKFHAHSEKMYVNKEDIVIYDLCPADIPLAGYVKVNV